METLKQLRRHKVSLRVMYADDVIPVLSDELLKKYSSLTVKEVDCPDLTQPPFNLAAPGLGGNPAVIQVGDPAYVVPNTLKEKLYDFKSVFEALDVPASFIVGAGGGCWPSYGHFTEMCANVVMDKGQINNRSKEVFTTNQECSGIVIRDADPQESKFACLGNFYACQGKRDKVIHIGCRRRYDDGNDDFPATINSILRNAFDYPIAAGMVFRMTQGMAEHHVAPKFAEGVHGTEQLMNWLLLPNVSAPFVSVGTLLTRNPPGWTLLDQHFHSFNERGAGGHYHYDFTPKEADYEAYISFAHTLYSFDEAQNAINLFNY